MAKASTYPGFVLRAGATGPAVERAQTQLNARGWTLTVDGIFGPGTRYAVNVFKRHHGMPEDGQLGPNAWAALFEEPKAVVAVERIRPLVVVRIHVASASPRLSPIDGIVLHDTEGANIKGVADLEGLGNYFNRLKSPDRASAHVGVDAEAQSARYVDDHLAAWHVADYNSRKLGIEQIGFASQATWPDEQLDETARWCAVWCARYDLPVIHSIDRGICRHSDLGAAGGGHHDPGPAYPLDDVLERTQHYLSRINQ